MCTHTHTRARARAHHDGHRPRSTMGDRSQEPAPRAKCDAALARLLYEHPKRLQAVTSALAHERTRIITALATQLEGSNPGRSGGGSTLTKKDKVCPCFVGRGCKKQEGGRLRHDAQRRAIPRHGQRHTTGPCLVHHVRARQAVALLLQKKTPETEPKETKGTRPQVQSLLAQRLDHPFGTGGHGRNSGETKARTEAKARSPGHEQASSNREQARRHACVRACATRSVGSAQVGGGVIAHAAGHDGAGLPCARVCDRETGCADDGVPLPGTHHPWTYPLCSRGIPNRGPRARVWTTGPGHFTRRKKKGESPGIGPFAELATPTFLTGCDRANFFF